MSSNPQWKNFQSPIMNSDPAILEYKSMSIPSPKMMSGHNHQSANNYRNGTNNFGGDFMDSPPGKNLSFNSSYSSGAQTSPRNGSATFSIGNFNAFETNYSGEPVMTNNSSSYQPNEQTSNQGPRETGIIEKLLHSYGFIQCCERQARLFFHFSQFSGNIEHLKIGDPVEFEMTYDRRTGKPIASIVSKIAPEVVLSAERVMGTVTTELQSNGDSQGRISYENRGECFFLPYTKDDVEGNVTLRNGDRVSFQIATNQRGNLGACHIRFENPAHPVQYRGVVCSMKESFGFIERADVVKEIFFHFSEAKSTKEELKLGDDVEFIIQTRNVKRLLKYFSFVPDLNNKCMNFQGKEVACNITKLPPGSIVFEEISDEIIKGQVLKPLDKSTPVRHQAEPLTGRIRHRAPDHSEVEVSFGDKDQKGDFTLKHGDWVQFRIATDTRDQLKRATEIELLPESFSVSGERREQGVIVALKDGYGFIRCAEREPRLFFKFGEVLDVERQISVGDEFEFTVIQDPSSSYANSRLSAIRLRHLPKGSVSFESIIEIDVLGKVVEETNGTERGFISYQKDDVEKTIMFFSKDCITKIIPKLNDKVQFSICQVKSNKELVAVDISLLSLTGEKVQNGTKKTTVQGFVAALKDGFGFIETVNHDKEIFFHFSNFEGDASTLELGADVECVIGTGNNSSRIIGGCTAAETVRLLPKGSIPRAKVESEVLDGTVIRPLRSANPEQVEYAGMIKVNPTNENEETPEYEFGIMGLANKRELLQSGDPVQFQLDSEGHACNIVAVRKKRRATVDAVKGPFGFLAYEVDEGKKLFFHMSEVCDNAKLQPGDQVEFVLVTNQRSGKSSACNVQRLNDTVQQRPERLISKLRTVSLEDNGPKLTVVRQPKGPDGTRGFSQERIVRNPGAIDE
ncbi:cold shock domain-containing protein E1 isoform X1 [Trichogramma pretiosum]|uniref:cold shock domain-containing protein E1 isoform X1 n=1 Tax=Trichogramma pretiosum TaxID=7493 RepID=UPI0006C96121|nr:cold shock domain-containing protein E1 isoform X1 [Trichogramma pretiosum]XP_014228592.1 cold shock domain-containing protein E1 isoform X1 [Trichogramma pretiosum]XP_014228593.1 cold shock domain-containing protein E1 isoform X1 [Trichogramma pretiosum]XP_014228594.1 cold shock domain-containing protein E1 isoform X1 [Trichogramma pretiosum]XP_023314784.1 cold shock domain-containing protein E1 isoform X1 [Trichogramma pretiosum]